MHTSPILAHVALGAVLLALPLSAQGGGSPPVIPDVVSCNGKINAGQRTLWVMTSDGQNARQVLNEDCKYAYPSLSPDGLQIAFTKTRNGTSAVWVVNHDGTGLRAVTPILLPIAQQFGRAFPMVRAVWSPVPAPDGQRKLLFVDRPGPDGSPWQLFAVNLDGSGRTQLTNATFSGVRGPASYEWSRDATRVAYLAYGGLFVADLGLVGGQLALTSVSTPPVPLPWANINGVAWANTGNGLVLAVGNPAHGLNHDLWIVDLANPSTPLQITNTADDEMLPTFSRDDSRVYFWSYSAAGGTHTVPSSGAGTRTTIHTKAQSPYHRRR